LYRVTTDARSQPQIDALPSDALGSLAEVRVLLEVSPWAGDSLKDDNPDAPVRSFAFGSTRQGLITYLILDSQRRVDVLDVLWLDGYAFPGEIG
jgi:hypothetical protein